MATAREMWGGLRRILLQSGEVVVIGPDEDRPPHEGPPSEPRGPQSTGSDGRRPVCIVLSRSGEEYTAIGKCCEVTTHRSRYALTPHHGLVLAALHFRTECGVGGAVLSCPHVHGVERARWAATPLPHARFPRTVESAPPGIIRAERDGTIRLRALDGNARAALDATRSALRFEFLLPLQDAQGRESGTAWHARDFLIDRVPRALQHVLRLCVAAATRTAQAAASQHFRGDFKLAPHWGERLPAARARGDRGGGSPEAEDAVCVSLPEAQSPEAAAEREMRRRGDAFDVQRSVHELYSCAVEASADCFRCVGAAAAADDTAAATFRLCRASDGGERVVATLRVDGSCLIVSPTAAEHRTVEATGGPGSAGGLGADAVHLCAGAALRRRRMAVESARLARAEYLRAAPEGADKAERVEYALQPYVSHALAMLAASRAARAGPAGGGGRAGAAAGGVEELIGAVGRAVPRGRLVQRVKTPQGTFNAYRDGGERVVQARLRDGTVATANLRAPEDAGSAIMTAVTPDGREATMRFDRPATKRLAKAATLIRTFADWAFLSDAERAKRAAAQQRRRGQMRAALDQSKRFCTILKMQRGEAPPQIA